MKNLFMLTYGYFVVWAMEDLEEVQLFLKHGHKKSGHPRMDDRLNLEVLGLNN